MRRRSKEIEKRLSDMQKENHCGCGKKHNQTKCFRKEQATASRCPERKDLIRAKKFLLDLETKNLGNLGENFH